MPLALSSASRPPTHPAARTSSSRTPHPAGAWSKADAAALFALAALTLLLFSFGTVVAGWVATPAPQRDLPGSFSARQAAGYR